MIYLDNAATTPVQSESAIAAQKAYQEYFLNPSATYRQADEVRKQIEIARETIADFLCCRPCEIVFTSGATEANNWAVLGGALKRQKLASVTSLGEHASVHEAFLDCKRRGIQIKLVPLDKDTSVNAQQFLLDAQGCGFASLIHASNETGAINDLQHIVEEFKAKNPDAIFHSDGVQAFCKIPTDVKKLGVDLYSISGHKVGALKGIGALYIRDGLRMRNMMLGGGQEGGLRAGTENVAGILSFAAGATAYRNAFRNNAFLQIKRTFWQILEGVGDIVLNGAIDDSLSNILSMSVIGLKSEVLQRILADEDAILIGKGSACSGSKRGNRVLEGAGKTQKEIEGNIRVSFGIDTDLKTAVFAANRIADRIRRLREVQHGRG